jgi:predicted acylesterase/phospholipase RssA
VNVDYVVGTSGGALLGYFAARLSGRGPWELDKKLWEWCRNPRPVTDEYCRPMQSTDIFGYLDMLRYVSAVAMLAMLAVVLYFTPPSAAPLTRTVRWRKRLLLSVVPTLLAIPLLVRYLNGNQPREQIPEVEGLVYAAAVLLAMFADQCLIVGEPSPFSTGAIVHRRRAGVALSVTGGVIVLSLTLTTWLAAQRWMIVRPGLHAWLPVAWIRGTWRVGDIIFGRDVFIHKGALVLCLAGLLVLLGLVLHVWRRPDYTLIGWREFLYGLGVGLLQIGLASVGIVLIVAVWPWGQPSLLELTLEYWLVLIVASAAAALLLVRVRRLRARARQAEWVARGIDFLTSGHPNGGSTRRLVRLVLHAALAIAWWNVVLAPGVYGNGRALQFLKGTDERFIHTFPDAATLKVPLIVTANVLKTEGSRYFLFQPDADQCPNISRRSGYGATWLRHRPRGTARSVDARCGTDVPNVGEWDPSYIRDVVFASGSPYPVFPAHRIDDKIGRLIDGGYANNVPLDAAQGIGADQVLIVESSNPLGHLVSPSVLGLVLDGVRVQGDLIDDLPKLFAFLWERSQELDRISRRELLVVSLAPSRDEVGWPTLVQFTGAVIRRMRQVAVDDWRDARRIGLVQSWGRPRAIHVTAREIGTIEKTAVTR